jgi:hypothetical protein
MVRNGYLNRIQVRTNKTVLFHRHKEVDMTMSLNRDLTQRKAD